MHEASLYEHNAYITLTYSDEFVPVDGGLNHKHFQDFMKRLRKRFGNDIRYYMCGEYGGEFGRPHFHAILFNIDFGAVSLWKRSSSGANLYRSQALEKLWTFGHSSIGAVTFESCAYVARYIMKKVTGKNASRAYDAVDTETGEVYSRRPEYNKMSNRSGIGAEWFKKYGLTDVYPHDRVVIDGTPSPPPRYYDKLYKRVNPASFDEIKSKRILDGSKRWEDNTPNRLVSKEAVTVAKLTKLKRGLT